MLIGKYENQLKQIQGYLQDLEKQSTKFNIQIVMKQIPTMHVVSIRRKMANYYCESILWQELSEAIKSIGHFNGGKSFSVYHDLDYREENTQSKSLLKYMTEQTCTHCNGEKLSREGRMVTIGTLRYPEVASMSFLELGKWCDALINLLSHADYEKIENQVAHLKELVSAAQSLGIEYLEMNRETGMIQALKEEGNTIVVIEHNKQFVANCHWKIELGPGAGVAGESLISQGRCKD
ncbi:MAG: hypothetical protein J6F30_12115 [Cellulosilyticum sp.]|nr:hypothetical protein [Cellulosilyticum sp.]